MNIILESMNVDIHSQCNGSDKNMFMLIAAALSHYLKSGSIFDPKTEGHWAGAEQSYQHLKPKTESCWARLRSPFLAGQYQPFFFLACCCQ